MIIDKKRTQILAEKFFFTFSITESAHNVYNLPANSVLKLNNYISAEEVPKIINRLLSRKTAELDRILNEVLKYITLKIYTDITHRIYIALICSLLSEHFKELIIIILHKENKKDYLLFKSYRLIALENILTKIIKKMLATHLSSSLLNSDEDKKRQINSISA